MRYLLNKSGKIPRGRIFFSISISCRGSIRSTLRPFGPEPFGPERLDLSSPKVSSTCLKAEGLKAEGLSTGEKKVPRPGCFRQAQALSLPKGARRRLNGEL